MIKYRSPSQKTQYVIGMLTFAIFIFTIFWSVLLVEYLDPNSYLWGFIGQSDISYRVTSMKLFDNLLNILLFSLFVSVLIYFLLRVICLNISRASLPEGFYTQNSWLDIDDKSLVAIQANELVFFKFDRKIAKRLQIEYQHNATVDELIELAGAKNIQRIPFDEITELVSDHNSDIFYVKQNGMRHRVMFINQTVKAHALELVQLLLPENLKYQRNERTRFKASLPYIIVFIGLALSAMTIELMTIRYLVSLFALLVVMPRLCSNYLDPKITEVWRHNDIRD